MLCAQSVAATQRALIPSLRLVGYRLRLRHDAALRLSNSQVAKNKRAHLAALLLRCSRLRSSSLIGHPLFTRAPVPCAGAPALVVSAGREQ